ncbi:CASP-like protein 1U1 [Panicum hallii]|uniref:CASP-like protein 1U1 n=1 Tax=Panicum hallii TaxID=206008 RepID=UPI000DF4DF89|nr:CASP-like protein 1U1 [Panicum hallii]
MSACRYFVVAGAISAVCSAAALYLCAVRAAAAIGSLQLQLVPLLDAAAQGLLFSAAGTAFAARGVVGGAAGPWGSSGVDVGGGGGSMCDAAGAFCGKVSVAAGVGACAAVAVAVAALARDARRRGSSGGSCDW